MEHLSVTYATHPTKKGDRPLAVDLYRPDGPSPADLLVWMHSGGFRTGSRLHRSHPNMAEKFTQAGYAVAFIDYRLARPVAVLRPRTAALVDPLVADAQRAGDAMHTTFHGHRPLAVVEDCCAFLQFAVARQAEWNLSGRYLLGGSSAGAISALNMLYLPEFLGLERPPIATVFAYSGGFAYPGFLRKTGARIYAQACPTDEKVPSSSIRHLHKTLRDRKLDPCLLVQHAQHVHGNLPLHPAERLRHAIQRAIAFDKAGDPMSLVIDVPGAEVFR